STEINAIDSERTGQQNVQDMFGAVVSTYITLGKSAEYIFYVSGNDETRLYLAEDKVGHNAKEIAYVETSTEKYEWNKFPSQTSQAISLEAGKQYQLLLVTQDDGGDEHYAVGWKEATTNKI